MQNIFVFIFVILSSFLTMAAQNIELVKKLEEQKMFYKSQPRVTKKNDLKKISLPASFDDEIVDLEAEFKKAEKAVSRRRLR